MGVLRELKIAKKKQKRKELEVNENDLFLRGHSRKNAEM